MFIQLTSTDRSKDIFVRVNDIEAILEMENGRAKVTTRSGNEWNVQESATKIHQMCIGGDL